MLPCAPPCSTRILSGAAKNARARCELRLKLSSSPDACVESISTSKLFNRSYVSPTDFSSASPSMCKLQHQIVYLSRDYEPHATSPPQCRCPVRTNPENHHSQAILGLQHWRRL